MQDLMSEILSLGRYQAYDMAPGRLVQVEFVDHVFWSGDYV